MSKDKLKRLKEINNEKIKLKSEIALSKLKAFNKYFIKAGFNYIEMEHFEKESLREHINYLKRMRLHKKYKLSEKEENLLFKVHDYIRGYEKDPIDDDVDNKLYYPPLLIN